MLSNRYILILIWVGFIGLLSVMIRGVYRMETVNGEKVRRMTPLFATRSRVGTAGNMGGLQRLCGGHSGLYAFVWRYAIIFWRN